MQVIENRKRKYLTDEDFLVAQSNGILYNTAHSRVYRYGWDADRAITEKPVKRKARGQSEWAKWKDKSLVGRETFNWRISEGWTSEEAALTPKLSRKEISERLRKYHKEKGERNE